MTAIITHPVPIQQDDWSEKHEISGRESRLLERAVEFYLHSIRAIETSLECDKANGTNTIMYHAEVRNLRDKIVASHSIRVIPDEDQ